jgi:hypothetical protein
MTMYAKTDYDLTLNDAPLELIPRVDHLLRQQLTHALYGFAIALH